MGLSDYYESARDSRLKQFQRLATSVAWDRSANVRSFSRKEGIRETLLILIDMFREDSGNLQDQESIDYLDSIVEAIEGKCQLKLYEGEEK